MPSHPTHPLACIFCSRKASIPVYFDACPTFSTHIIPLAVEFNKPFSGSNINHHGFSGVWVFCVPPNVESVQALLELQTRKTGITTMDGFDSMHPVLWNHSMWMTKDRSNWVCHRKLLSGFIAGLFELSVQIFTHASNHFEWSLSHFMINCQFCSVCSSVWS